MSTDLRVEQLLAAGRFRDPRGDRVHFVFAWVYFLMVPLGATLAGVMLGILGVMFLLRLWAVYHTVGRLVVRSGLVWVLFLSMIWILLSLGWSRDRVEGLDEIGALRAQLPLLFFIWPVLTWRRIGWLIDAVSIGVVLTAILQVGQWLGIGWCWSLGFSGGVVGRPPGFLHPSLTAVVALVTGGWALVEVLRGACRRRRFLGLVVCGAAAVSILLTGSRGPWLATGVAWPTIFVMSVFAAGGIRSGSGLELSVKKKWAVVGVVVLGVICGGWFLRGSVSARVGRLVDESRMAMHEGNYQTDVGARIMQVEIAVGLWEAAPILGVGAGSYFAAGDAMFREGTMGKNGAESERGRVPVRRHPHSAILYALAVTGLPGVILYLAFWGILGVESLRVVWRSGLGGRGERGERGERVTLALPGLVVGLIVAFAVDGQNLSMPGLAMLTLVLSVVVLARIRAVEERGSETD